MEIRAANYEQSLERIEIVTGDITRLNVDAIVNATNESLLGGGAEHYRHPPPQKPFEQAIVILK